MKPLSSIRRGMLSTPDYTTAHYNLACAYSLKNEKTLAIETLQKAITLDQKYIEISKTDSDLIISVRVESFSSLSTQLNISRVSKEGARWEQMNLQDMLWSQKSKCRCLRRGCGSGRCRIRRAICRTCRRKAGGKDPPDRSLCESRRQYRDRR